MSDNWENIFVLSSNLGKSLRQRNLTLATAESCTAGGISYALTHNAGSSDWFVGGVVAYSNHQKHMQLGVSEMLIKEQGAVSEAVVGEMAAGAVKRLDTDIGLAVSGIAGPDGGTEEKPVGTVCFGWTISGKKITETQHFLGDRETVRLSTIAYSLEILLDSL